jgi:hypothetical protein
MQEFRARCAARFRIGVERQHESNTKNQKPIKDSEEDMTQVLATNRMGRVVLHTVCAFRDHHWAWHWRGILREVHKNAHRVAAVAA